MKYLSHISLTFTYKGTTLGALSLLIPTLSLNLNKARSSKLTQPWGHNRISHILHQATPIIAACTILKDRLHRRIEEKFPQLRVTQNAVDGLLFCLVLFKVVHRLNLLLVRLLKSRLHQGTCGVGLVLALLLLLLLLLLSHFFKMLA